MLNPGSAAIVRDIKALRIQGAENVARAGLTALALQAQHSTSATPAAFLHEMAETVRELWTARPTEPALRNALRYVFLYARKQNAKSVPVLSRAVAQAVERYQVHADQVKASIGQYGERLIPEEGRILVHCHSSTVTRAIKRAFDAGKNPHVFCTESRPLYQGHITARELSQYGVKVTMCVDGAVHLVLSQLKDTDLVMVGADAITAQGDLVNKIGTAMIAHAAFDHEKRFYALTGSHKFDPQTLFGWSEPIEQRPPQEVADPKKFPGVEIYNPAFDLTPARFLTAYVTEWGVLPPQGLVARASREMAETTTEGV